MSDGYTVVALGELGLEMAGNVRWHTIRSTLGIQAFGINAWTATADGQQVIGEHDEAGEGATGHEEVYIVVSGHATFTVGGEPVDGPQGTIVFVSDPAVKRGGVGVKGTTILVVGGKRGEAFAPSPWERNAEAFQYWPTEEWGKAIEVLERFLAETPESAGVLYNLACAEARAGKTEEALEHVAAAVALESRFDQIAPTDDDLASIREDPRFPSG